MPMNDDIKALLTAALHTDPPKGIRALDDRKRLAYASGEQISTANTTDLGYWAGLTPVKPDADELVAFLKGLVVDDQIGPALDRFIMGMLGKDWEWALSQDGSDTALDPADERVAALTVWHKDADAWGALKQFAKHILSLNVGGTLRVYIPAAYSSEEAPLQEGSQKTYADALEMIHVQAVPGTQGGPLVDEYGREIGYYYAYTVTLQSNGMQSKTESRVEVHTPDQIGVYHIDGSDYTVISEVENPLYDPALKRKPRYLMHTQVRDGGSIIQSPVIDLQNSLNVFRSNARKNADLAGHRQYITIDAIDPVDPETRQPIPYSFGARKVVSAKSIVPENGQTALQARVQVIDPVDPQQFITAANDFKAALLGNFDQTWVLGGDVAQSGASKQETRAAFDRRLGLEAEPVTRGATWLIETVLRLAAWLVGKPKDAEGITAGPRLYLDVAPVTLETYNSLKDANLKGQLSLESLLENTPGVSNSETEAQRVRAGREEDVLLALEAFKIGALDKPDMLVILQAAGLKVSPESVRRANDLAAMDTDLALNPKPVVTAGFTGGLDG